MENTRACVAVKVGEFGHTSRTSVPVEDAEFEFDGGRDNFERVYSLADGKLYLKPSQHAKQAQFMALTSETWPGMLAQARANYHKQKTLDGPFVVHMLMYAAKEVRQGIRRATSTRIAEAAEAIDSYLAERQDVRVGKVSRTHWGISHAHQPDDASVTLPESATFRKMQHLDATSASRHEGDREEGVYCTLTVILNSSRDMQLTFNIEELRAVIQLPKYRLIAEGLFSNFQPHWSLQ
ncbi:hypothetical protein GQ600_7931 [Phytophthora cactorum]|nr:hypothetical protein GQ600_7931 [Phytophthora cactorum]